MRPSLLRAGFARDALNYLILNLQWSLMSFAGVYGLRVARLPSKSCQTSKTRMRAQLDIRTERLAHTSGRAGARSASEMQSYWLEKSKSKSKNV